MKYNVAVTLPLTLLVPDVEAACPGLPRLRQSSGQL
jgi:hypothetical protein